MTNSLPAPYLMAQNYKHPLRNGNKTEMSSFTTLFNTVLEVLDAAIRQEEEIKGIQIVMEEVNCHLQMT